MLTTNTLPPQDYPYNFVVLWSFGGRLWSDTLRWNNGVLEEYRYESDDFVESVHHTRARRGCTYVLHLSI